MYYSHYRSNNTSRIIILTSIFWIIFVFIIIVNYDDQNLTAQSGNLMNDNDDIINSDDAINNVDFIDNSNLEDDDDRLFDSNEIITSQNIDAAIDDKNNSENIISIPLTYDRFVLKKWKRPPIVPNMDGIPGEMGKAVVIPEDMHEVMNETFKENQFNLLASDMISLNRSLPDVRNKNCKNKIYPIKLPTTSIVIVFHNEAWSTLIRTIWSIINRSPRQLLKEIILVDDASEREFLGDKLNDYIKTLPIKTFLLRTNQRSGLIKARLLGAKYVAGEIITFLDAHCECSEGWIEPLLARIVQNRKTVVCPVIDVISDKTFEYIVASDTTWGGFDWKLNFRWYMIPEREMKRRNHNNILPIYTPTMAGGLFSIDKEYFYEIGSYDEGMDIWGAENLEISFRIWQCGGILEIIPCSHVGHVFRANSPYTFPGGASQIILHNTARVVEVWLDEWKDLYYAMVGNKSELAGDVSDRIALRNKLKCKSFKWYLETIYPETTMPFNYHYIGEIRNVETQTCLDTMGRQSNEKIGMFNCHGLGANQLFTYTKNQEIMSNSLCLDAANMDGPVLIIRCHNMGGNQKWFYNETDKTIHHNIGNCLQRSTNDEPEIPLLRPCDSSTGQQWLMESKFDWKF